MEKVAFLDTLDPTVVEVAGVTVRMHFTMRAAARIEQALGKPYADVVLEMLQLSEDGFVPPMALERQMTIVCILMEEAGQVVEKEALRDLHMAQFALLSRAAQHEMLNKSPRGDAKKNDKVMLESSAGQS